MIALVVIVRHIDKLHILWYLIHYNPGYLSARLRRHVLKRKCVTNQTFLIKISHGVSVVARILHGETLCVHRSVWCIYVRESDVIHHVFVAGRWFDKLTKLLRRLNRLCANTNRIV